MNILKAKEEEKLKIGVVDGKMGTAQVHWERNGQLLLRNIILNEEPPPPLRLSIIIGTPRPPTARRLLRDLTSLGVLRIHWTGSALGEKSYLDSTLWVKNEYQDELLLGAMQGRTTLLPQIGWTKEFHRIFQLTWPQNRFYLSYKGGTWPRHPTENAVIAVGPERGFTQGETDRLEREGFQPLNLGPMTLRTETAAIAAAVLARELWSNP